MPSIRTIKPATPLPVTKWICLWLSAAFAWLVASMPVSAQVPSPLAQRAIDRGTEYYNSTAAADAATEKVFQAMSADFLQGGGNLLNSRIGYYESLIPNASDDPYWANYAFTSPVGGAPGVWVGLIATNTPGPFAVSPGYSLFNLTYRIAANAESNNSPTGLTAAVWQDMAFDYVMLPIFSYAIYYNGTLEFSDCPPMTVNGPVYCNTNINVGSPSSLIFNYFVNCVGYITNPPAMGLSQSSWTGTVSFAAAPSPGYGTGEAPINLPIGLNPAGPFSPREIINPPPPGENVSNGVSAQRYYNKADMVIIITNAYVPSSTNFLLVTNTNSVLLTNAVFITFKSTMYDTGNTYAVTNGVQGNINGINYTAEWNAWTANGFTNWLSLTNTFYDQRQSAYQHVVQIDIGKLGQWIGTSNGIVTNFLLTPKWNSTTPFNGIIYIQDLRSTSTNWQNCVRLMNAQNITNGLYQGLTVATQNPLYIMGLYNCPGVNNVSSTNTIGCRPCSVVCDALTILSPNWQTSGYDNFTYSAGNYAFRPASANDTVNTAIIAGNVPTTDTTSTGFSGGMHNLPRLLESWIGDNLYLNTSFVCLYSSAQATAQFQEPGVYYEAPTRRFSFDLNFLNPLTQPPGALLETFVARLDRLNPNPTNNPAQ